MLDSALLDAPCPCGRTDAKARPLAYAACCGALHQRFAATGRWDAPDAEALMRSRYSAFTLDLLDYLRATWHPDTRPATLDANEAGLKWLGLQIKSRAQQDPDHATVEFVARSKLGGRAWRLHETSRFVRLDGQWHYLDGDLR